MSIVEIKSDFSHRALMNKRKDDLAHEVMWRHQRITYLSEQMLAYGGHNDDCSWWAPYPNPVCNCGFAEAERLAKGWLAG